MTFTTQRLFTVAATTSGRKRAVTMNRALGKGIRFRVASIADTTAAAAAAAAAAASQSFVTTTSASSTVQYRPRMHGCTCGGINSSSRKSFSTNAAAVATDKEDSGPKPVDLDSFQFDKSKAVFQQITASINTVEDVRTLQAELYMILGRPLRENEFYFAGFGKKRKGKGGDDGESTVAAPVQTSFDVKLLGYDKKSKIKIIKEIRSITALGLKEAKELVDSAPSVIRKGISQDDAKAIQDKIVELGGEVEVV